MSDSKQTLLEVLGPKKSFGAGFLSAVVVFFVIGFFVLLSGGNFLSFSNEKDVVTFGDNTEQVTNENGSDSGSAEIALKPVTSNDHVRGDLNTASAVIVEFSDYDCPFCARFHETMQQVRSKYPDSVAWVYRHFPLDSLHPEARTKAEASECVAELGGNEAFWKFTDIMFDKSRSVKAAQLNDIAGEVGVSVADFKTCMSENRYKDKVQSQYQDAVASGGRGTPHSIVVTKDGQQIPVSGALPFEQIKSILDPLVK